MSNTDEALKIWNALKPMIDREIEAKTRSCVRAKKMTVTTAPEDGVIGVTETYGDEIFIPYSSEISSAQAGDAVWVWWFCNNASAMIALSMGNGQLKSDREPVPASVSDRLNDTSITSPWTNSGGVIVDGPEMDTKTLVFNIFGIPQGASIDSAVFSATFSAPYSGADTFTVNGNPITSGLQSVTLTPTATGNGSYTVEIKLKAIGDPSLSDGVHYSTSVITAPTVTVNYSA